MSIANKDEYIGSNITIKEAIILFPNRWIAISDFSFEKLRVEEGILVDVMTDDEADTKLHKYITSGYYCMRTTSNYSGGAIVTVEKIESGK